MLKGESEPYEVQPWAHIRVGLENRATKKDLTTRRLDDPRAMRGQTMDFPVSLAELKL